MKQLLAALLALTMLLSLAACAKTTNTTDTAPSDTAQSAKSDSAEPTTLTYGSADYTRINPAMDEHGEINLLLFDGLTAHDGENNVVPGLAETWELDEATNTYTFHLRENLTWHDGEPVTADDVKFTIEAIMDPENGSENAPNFEDVEEITVTDDHTVSFRLSAPNVAFLDYMTMAVLPEHLLAGEDWQEKAERYRYHAKPFTKESLLYREIFEKYYPGQAGMVTDFWMPNRSWEGCDVDDPSARVLSNYGASGQ